eukprot:GHVT01062147.1.p1 GENE.GHVT01062147.1~~GHVT01062147.1.p1  ORF type:complete len:417 (+),score=96.21 GHVT01062147.1:1907-3157(+)
MTLAESEVVSRSQSGGLAAVQIGEFCPSGGGPVKELDELSPAVGQTDVDTRPSAAFRGECDGTVVDLQLGNAADGAQRGSGGGDATAPESKAMQCAQPPAAEGKLAGLPETQSCVSRFVLRNSKFDMQLILTSFNNFILDCDGVIWSGGNLLENSKQAIALIRAHGHRVTFLTNNASKSRRQYVEKFKSFDIAVDYQEVVSSSFLAAYHLSTNFPAVRRALVIGEGGLRDELRLLGIEPVTCVAEGQGEGIADEESFRKYAEKNIQTDVGAVVIGWDRQFSYHHLCVASLYLQRFPHLPLIATNRDAYDKIGSLAMPGNGAAVAALEVASGRAATSVGKPSDSLVRWMRANLNADPQRTLLIGDRLDTDMAVASLAGFQSALVLTGCTTEAQLEKVSPSAPNAPSFVLPSLGLLAQ